MLSTDIEAILEGCTEFHGCFPLDKLPSFPPRLPSSMIVNTDISIKSGDHWLGLILSKNKCFYFDSFGLPIIDTSIVKYLKPHYKSVTYSDICIQDVESNKCGEFCIAFIKHVKSKSSYKKFLSHFNLVNVKENVIIIDNWIINLNASVYKKS